MKKLNKSKFMHIIGCLFLIILGCIIVIPASLSIIVAISVIDARISMSNVSEYHILIALIVIGFIIEIFLNKIRKRKEKKLLSTMTEEERIQYKKESSEHFEERWWHEPFLYLICFCFIEMILKLFNIN